MKGKKLLVFFNIFDWKQYKDKLNHLYIHMHAYSKLDAIKQTEVRQEQLTTRKLWKTERTSYR